MSEGSPSIYFTAVAKALAIRNACEQQAEKGQPISSLDIGASASGVAHGAAACTPCPDDVFEGMATAIQAQSGCTAAQAFEQVLRLVDPSRPLLYSRWRHGGWYVSNVRHSSGACGCVRRNYADRKWRIVCDSRRQALNAPGDVTFHSRDDAAHAERLLALQAWTASVRSPD